MSDDKIAEIRARHAQSDDNFIEYESTWDIHADRATLLAEVERLTGKLKLVADALNDTISKYHEVGDQVDRLDAEIKRLREALRWYADQRNYFPVERRSPGDPDPAVVFVDEPAIMTDWGRRARAALEGKP